jgi:hypothetical protein
MSADNALWDFLILRALLLKASAHHQETVSHGHDE